MGRFPCYVWNVVIALRCSQDRNRFWDLQLGWRDNIGDFSYSVNFNLSDYRSVMGNMSGKQQESGGTITMEGVEYMSWYGFKSNGLYQNAEDLANSPVLNANTTVGDIKYLDVNGSEGLPDGAISAQYDRVVLPESCFHLSRL